MKIRNFIIQCIVVALTVSGIGCCSADAVTSDAIYDKNLAVIEALAINDGIEKEQASEVSRSEFVAMAVRLLNIGSLGFTNYYTDVTEASAFANEISAAKKLGIAGGVTDTEFSPASPVTYAQALKMLVCALGLDQPAKVGGGYPFGYMKVAENLDITDGISFNTDLPLTYSDAILLIYNTLFSKYIDVDKVAVDNPESILYYTQSDALVIERYFNYSVKEGVVWAAGEASMHLSAGSHEVVEIDGEKFSYKASDIADYLGLEVVAVSDRNNNIVVIVPTENNKVHTLLADDVTEFADSYVEAYVGDKEKKFSFSQAYTLLRNWRASSGADMDYADGQIVVIDNNNDGRFEVVHIMKAETMIVANVSGNTVADKYSGKIITLPDEISVVRGNDTALISPEELVSNMILSVYTDDRGAVSRAIAGYDILHGATVTAKDNEFIYIDGEAFKTSSYFNTHFNIDPEIGSRITAYFDSLGKICYMEKYISKDSGGMNYGFLIGTKFGGDFGAVLLNILKSDGEIQAFNLKDKIVLDGISGIAKDSEAVKSKLTRDGSKVKYTLIKYGVGSTGEITRIDTPEVRSSDADFADRYAGTSWDSSNSLTCFVQGAKAMYRGTGSFFPYCIYNSPIVFDVPTTLATQPNEDYDEALFNVRTKGFADNDKCTLDLYDYDSGFAPAVIINYANAGSGIKPVDVDMDDDPIAVVTDISYVLNDDGDETVGLALIEGGKEKRMKLASRILPYFEEKNLVPQKGDMIQYATDGVGDIAGITLFDYNPDTGIFNIDYSKTGDNILDAVTFISGKVYSISATHIAFAASTKPAAFSGVDHPEKYFIFKRRDSLTIVNCNISEDEFGMGSASDIATVEAVGEANASDVIMRLDWGTPVMMAVYN